MNLEFSTMFIFECRANIGCKEYSCLLTILFQYYKFSVSYNTLILSQNTSICMKQ